MDVTVTLHLSINVPDDDTSSAREVADALAVTAETLMRRNYGFLTAGAAHDTRAYALTVCEAEVRAY